MEIDEDELTYETRCSCGVEGEVTLDGEGIANIENVHHDDASWNQEGESDD
jgi:hypothetical protein